MKNLLGKVGEIHTPKVIPNFRRPATPSPEPYNLLDEFDLIEDQLLFSTTNTFNDKDAGTFHSTWNSHFDSTFGTVIVSSICDVYFLDNAFSGNWL